jgi:type IV pilus assembly protein PilC
MLTYNYTARNAKTGEKISSEVQADSEQAAAKLIRQEGLAPLDITIKGGDGGGLFAKFKNRIPAKDRILFSRQLSTLINAGLPLVQSLRSVSQQTPNKALQAVISKVINDVEAGAAFSVALSRHPRVFNQIYISLIAAGETSGTLDKALERLAFSRKRTLKLSAKSVVLWCTR